MLWQMKVQCYIVNRCGTQVYQILLRVGLAVTQWIAGRMFLKEILRYYIYYSLMFFFRFLHIKQDQFLCLGKEAT